MAGLAALAAALAIYYLVLRPRMQNIDAALGTSLRRWGGPALLTLALLAALVGRFVPAAALVLLAFALIGYNAGGEAAQGSAKGRSANPMGRDEALAVLGLAEGAGPAEIQEAYRRLIVKVHPDRGGSADLAARLNHARDVLLGEAP